MSSEKGVVIFSKSSCCMSYAVQVLFQDLGVHPTVHEIDKDPDCREIEKALMRLGCSTPVPAVFVGERSGYIQQELVLHVLCIQVLFQTVHEIDKDPDCREIEKALMRLGCSTPVPAIFVGGKLMGSTTEAMSMHLSGSLVPLVKPFQANLC
ncbi:hypothetical protein Bca4012_033557 [Brassica carinata]|uniref:Glutaredoxin domain-containing protein n=1 Tax=Brassica carinata TaxID=52824 RepID=A0A8X7RIA2_BRACI|nr:hypothetical protein Bca52824_045483 [Brassica carinata]